MFGFFMNCPCTEGKSLSATVFTKYSSAHIIKMSKYNEMPQESGCTYLITNHDASSVLLSSQVLKLYQDIKRTFACLCEHCYVKQFGNTKFRSLVLSH